MAVLNIIDLHGFKLLRRVASPSDVGLRRYGFQSKGALIVSGVQGQNSATTGGNVTNTGEDAVETLALPDLKPETVCSYTIVKQDLSAQTHTTPERKGMPPQTRPTWFRLVRPCTSEPQPLW